ncbi:FtsX-like permease family protein [bacterium]|nr:FtsX-like permease family protein [bacterium]
MTWKAFLMEKNTLINYFATRTGIPINFGITVFLGVIIGAAITAQTFYLFVVENTKQFAAMKAFGVTNGQLFRLVMLQATFVGVVGYSLGMGLTALFIRSVGNVPAFRGLTLHWQVVAGAAVMITLIIAIAVSVSLIKVFRADPAMVFKG